MDEEKLNLQDATKLDLTGTPIEEWEEPKKKTKQWVLDIDIPKPKGEPVPSGGYYPKGYIPEEIKSFKNTTTPISEEAYNRPLIPVSDIEREYTGVPILGGLEEASHTIKKGAKDLTEGHPIRGGIRLLTGLGEGAFSIIPEVALAQTIATGGKKLYEEIKDEPLTPVEEKAIDALSSVVAFGPITGLSFEAANALTDKLIESDTFKNTFEDREDYDTAVKVVKLVGPAIIAGKLSKPLLERKALSEFKKENKDLLEHRDKLIKQREELEKYDPEEALRENLSEEDIVNASDFIEAEQERINSEIAEINRELAHNALRKGIKLDKVGFDLQTMKDLIREQEKKFLEGHKWLELPLVDDNTVSYEGLLDLYGKPKNINDEIKIQNQILLDAISGKLQQKLEEEYGQYGITPKRITNIEFKQRPFTLSKVRKDKSGRYILNVPNARLSLLSTLERGIPYGGKSDVKLVDGVVIEDGKITFDPSIDKMDTATQYKVMHKFFTENKNLLDKLILQQIKFPRRLSGLIRQQSSRINAIKESIATQKTLLFHAPEKLEEAVKDGDVEQVGKILKYYKTNMTPEEVIKYYDENKQLPDIKPKLYIAIHNTDSGRLEKILDEHGKLIAPSFMTVDLDKINPEITDGFGDVVFVGDLGLFEGKNAEHYIGDAYTPTAYLQYADGKYYLNGEEIDAAGVNEALQKTTERLKQEAEFMKEEGAMIDSKRHPREKLDTISDAEESLKSFEELLKLESEFASKFNDKLYKAYNDYKRGKEVNEEYKPYFDRLEKQLASPRAFHESKIYEPVDVSDFEYVLVPKERTELGSRLEERGLNVIYYDDFRDKINKLKSLEGKLIEPDINERITLEEFEQRAKEAESLAKKLVGVEIGYNPELDAAGEFKVVDGKPIITINPQKVKDTTGIHEVAHAGLYALVYKHPDLARKLLVKHGWKDPQGVKSHELIDKMLDYNNDLELRRAWESVAREAEEYYRNEQTKLKYKPATKFYDKLKQLFSSLADLINSKRRLTKAFYNKLKRGELKDLFDEDYKYKFSKQNALRELAREYNNFKKLYPSEAEELLKEYNDIKEVLSRHTDSEVKAILQRIADEYEGSVYNLAQRVLDRTTPEKEFEFLTTQEENERDFINTFIKSLNKGRNKRIPLEDYIHSLSSLIDSITGGKGVRSSEFSGLFEKRIQEAMNRKQEDMEKLHNYFYDYIMQLAKDPERDKQVLDLYLQAKKDPDVLKEANPADAKLVKTVLRLESEAGSHFDLTPEELAEFNLPTPKGDSFTSHLISSIDYVTSLNNLGKLNSILKRTFNSEEVREVLVKKYGEKNADKVINALEDARIKSLSNISGRITPFERAYNNIIGKLYRAILVNPYLMLKQLSSMPLYKLYGADLKYALTNPIKVFREVYKNSPSFRKRWQEGWNEHLRNAYETYGMSSEKKSSIARTPLGRDLFRFKWFINQLKRENPELGVITPNVFVKVGDILPVMFGQYATYKTKLNQYIKDFKEDYGRNPDERELKVMNDAAWRYSELATNTTQQTPEPHQTSRIAQTQNMAFRIFTPFTSSPILTTQIAINQGNIAPLMQTAFIYSIFNNPQEAYTVYQTIMGNNPSNDKIKDMSKFITSMLQANFSVPFIRQTIEGLRHLTFDEEFPFSIDILAVTPLERAIKEYSKGRKDSLIKATSLLADYTGIPVSRILREIDKAKQAHKSLGDLLETLGYGKYNLPKRWYRVYF